MLPEHPPAALPGSGSANLTREDPVPCSRDTSARALLPGLALQAELVARPDPLLCAPRAGPQAASACEVEGPQHGRKGVAVDTVAAWSRSPADTESERWQPRVGLGSSGKSPIQEAPGVGGDGGQRGRLSACEKRCSCVCRHRTRSLEMGAGRHLPGRRHTAQPARLSS